MSEAPVGSVIRFFFGVGAEAKRGCSPLVVECGSEFYPGCTRKRSGTIAGVVRGVVGISVAVC